MAKKISIIIPVYEQADLCRSLLESIRKQTFKDLEVIILDDGSVKNDYKKLLTDFKDLDISYHRNEKNLGAMKNMEKALTMPLSSIYRIVFHEDDLMQAQLLEREHSLLENNAKLAFVGTSMYFFDTEADTKNRQDAFGEKISASIYKEQKEFVSDLFRGISFCFGSVMYRNAALSDRLKKSGPLFDLERFGTLCDRPFLLTLMTQDLSEAAFIREQLVYYRKHGSDDTRSRKLRTEQLISFYSFYRSFFPSKMRLGERKLFYGESTNNMLDSYTRIYPDMSMPFDQFLSVSFQKGLLSFWWLNGLGIKALRKILMKRT